MSRNNLYPEEMQTVQGTAVNTKGVRKNSQGGGEVAKHTKLL